MNEKDSEKLLGILETIGYEEVETEEADFLIFNTCTVRENANTKLYGHLGQVKKMKEKSTDDDRVMWMYDAGRACDREDSFKL